MVQQADIKEAVRQKLNEDIVGFEPIGGGSIAQAAKIKLKNGQQFFLKYGDLPENMFVAEANGLNELRKTKLFHVPGTIVVNSSFLLLEFIEQGVKPSNFQEQFGIALAKHHKYPVSSNGFYEDNYIGSSPQYNIPTAEEKANWPLFYFNKRLLPQVTWAKENGYFNERFKKAFSNIEQRFSEILYTNNSDPSILHGDLWAGNYMCNSVGTPVLIDPAVYHGHREADLAMTKMFGGFDASFYKSYKQTYPLEKGYEYRENLYLLYHYLNHLNLFGSGYLENSIRLMEFYA